MKLSSITSILFMFCCQADCINVTANSTTVTQLQQPTAIIERIFQGYNKLESPQAYSTTYDPVIVNYGIYIQEMFSISGKTMEFSLRLYLRRQWNDPRLAYSLYNNILPQIILRSDVVVNMWVPAGYIMNEHQSKFHTVTRNNERTQLNPTGAIQCDSRYSFVLSCKMDLRSFPLDTQYCQIEIQSLYSVSEVLFVWSNSLPLELPAVLSLPSFFLTGYVLENCPDLKQSDPYPCLRAIFILKRNYNYHIISIYVPSVIVVCVSWLAFYIAPESVPGRVTIGTSSVLNIITQGFVGGLSLPKVPYPKAVDIWMASCTAFVFLALVEFAFVNMTLRAEMHNEVVDQANINHQILHENLAAKLPAEDLLKKIRHFLANMNTRSTDSSALKIDYFSRFFFPVSFAIFSTTYWIYYLFFYKSYSEFARYENITLVSKHM